MSKKQFRSQASSARAGAFDGFGGSRFGSSHASSLSYIQEPPDYSAISDANVVVLFKNLSKRDGTTKAKALEDLQSYLNQANAAVEDGLLEAWVKLFPRLSIDTERRVRLFSHNLNGSICAAAGKRTAKHMPRLAGPWLAGTHDNDRAVSQAAQRALEAVFSSPEKLQTLRRAFHPDLMRYCREAAFLETPQTLSDERIVSKEDAEATYARVVATVLSVVGNLLRDLPSEDISKQQHSYEELFHEPKLWGFVTDIDVNVRRAMHRLARESLQVAPFVLDQAKGLVSTAYINKGLVSDQIGSALEFTLTLRAFTAELPSIWTSDYHGKKSAEARLAKWLQKGSHGSASAEYWQTLASVLQRLPIEALPGTTRSDVVNAMRDGLVRKEERFAEFAAWQAYFALASRLADSASSENERTNFIDTNVLPVIRQFLHPSPDNAEFSIHSTKASTTAAHSLRVPGCLALLQREMGSFADALIETAKRSQPEQAKEFTNSQTEVTRAGERWAHLQRDMHAIISDNPSSLHQAFTTENTRVLGESVELLVKRNGKPYGAAAIIDELVRSCGKWLLLDERFKAIISDFATHHLPKMMIGPAQRQLIDILYALNTTDCFETSFKTVLSLATPADDDDTETHVQLLKSLFTMHAPEAAVSLARADVTFQKACQELYKPVSLDVKKGLFADLIAVHSLTDSTIHEITAFLIESLANQSLADASLYELEAVGVSSVGTLQEVASEKDGVGNQLLPNLLRLEDSQDDSIADRAHTLSNKISTAAYSAASANRFAPVINQLEDTSASSMSFDTLVELLDRLMGPQQKVDDPVQLLPQIGIWQSSLRAVMQPPRPSLAILSPLGGAAHFVEHDLQPGKVRVDADGFSQALRIAMYTARLLRTTELAKEMDANVYGEILQLLTLTRLVTEDNLGVFGSNEIFSRASPEVDVQVLGFLADVNAIDMTGLNVDDLLEMSERDFQPLSFYSALAYASNRDNHFERNGSSSEVVQISERSLNSFFKKASNSYFARYAYLCGHQRPLSDSPGLVRICNELVSDLTYADFVSKEESLAPNLCLLNRILTVPEFDGVSTIAIQRLAFLVKNLSSALESDVTIVTKVECSKALNHLLVGMADRYGEHWTQVLSFITASWQGWKSEKPFQNEDAELEYYILLVNSTLKLYGTLRRIAGSEDPNDELVSLLESQRGDTAAGLINVLKSLSGLSDELHQPLMVTGELLARETARLSVSDVKNVEELFPLLYSPSRAIQQGTFDLLHRKIINTQEQVSFDVALNNETAQLPDELLSLLLEAPTLDSLADASFDRFMPPSLQGYLFSWHLLFDHFENASFKVTSSYVDEIKMGGYLPLLLSLTFDFLGHTRGKPIDASKFEITEYRPGEAPDPEKDVQWFLIHLYYLSLRNLPLLTKSYFLENRSRQTSPAIESWTAKYISPVIIQASLRAVGDKWRKPQVNDNSGAENDMEIKVGLSSREVTASYVVDEQTMAIKVVLPEAYPLASAQVLGVSRVAVKEEKWQSWLRNCQGVITFSNGSITDGLLAWRRNVTGALEGQTECAICYSIISGDKQLPNKKCPTCKHWFHNSCLYKWFKTSNANTCPLCRNAFQFN